MIVKANDVYDYIDINKSELPERFEIDLADETFLLQFNYNETGDFFTVDLYGIGDEEDPMPIVYGEKLVLGRPLWENITSDDIPAPTLMPLDIGMEADRITFENLGVSVFLYIVDGDGEELAT